MSDMRLRVCILHGQTLYTGSSSTIAFSGANENSKSRRLFETWRIPLFPDLTGSARNSEICSVNTHVACGKACSVIASRAIYVDRIQCRASDLSASLANNKNIYLGIYITHLPFYVVINAGTPMGEYLWIHMFPAKVGSKCVERT